MGGGGGGGMGKDLGEFDFVTSVDETSLPYILLFHFL